MKDTMFRIGLLFLLTAGFILHSAAQLTVYGSVTARVDSLSNAMPSGNGTNEYQAPTSGQQSAWVTMVAKIMQGNYSGANTDAAAFGYHLYQFIDTTTSPRSTYYLLEKNAGATNHWGTYFFNPSPMRPKLVIASPHDIYDTNTGREGRQVFVRNGARAFFLNGSHRCNSSSFTACSGTTTACNDTAEKYRLSDQAHTTTGMFQKTTEAMRSAIPGMIMVQPHGFSQGSGDPDIIMSNGTRNTPSTDYLVILRDNLLTIDPTLTFKITHIDLTWTKLIATENVQGRLINGSSNPCSNDATTSNGRFLHLEQAYSGLRDNETNRRKLSDAISKTFPADTLILTSPQGGESWQGGTSHSITWTKTGLVDTVRLEYSLDGGGIWSVIAAKSPNSGSYTWTLPAAATWRALVRITDIANSRTGDTTAQRFSITNTVWPISGTNTPDLIASAFGPRYLGGAYDFHRGFDLPNNLNTPVHPVRPGVIARMEDTTVTAGSGLARYGNWIMVSHQPDSGQPRATGYLHLNGFGRFHVGDTVSTADTIAFMGSSGQGINTIHTHLEYYKNLTGTLVDKDKIFNPLEILPYTDLNSYVVSTLHRGDSTGIVVEMTQPELDLDQFVIYGELATRTIGFNSRTGINPSDNDNPLYNGTFIDPDTFTKDSSVKRITFWTKLGETGVVDSVRITDLHGYSWIVVDYSGQRYAVTSGDWDAPIWAGTPSGTPGSVSAPGQYDDVVVNSGVTVTVSSASPACRSISFTDATSHIALAALSRLNVYGNFVLASTSHHAFSSWAAGSKLRFAGANHQVLSGWSTTSSVDTNTSLMEVVVDKSGDTLTTPGTDMKLTLGTSFEIVSGIFCLDSVDDINGKSFDGTAAAAPSITVDQAGLFLMRGAASSIRSGSSGSNPIGLMTLFGKATVTTSSSLGINFGNISVEQGGTLGLTTGWSANKLNCGTVTVKRGGTISNSTTSNAWAASASVVLQNGGEYRTSSATTTFPVTFTNQGTVHYTRAVSGDQTITDMNYYRLEISYSGNNKVWALGAARTITDSCEINNSAALVLSASAAQSVTVNGTLRLTSGTLNATGANVTLALANHAVISRATGTLAGTPQFGASVDLRYTSTLTSVTTGPEIPSSVSVLRDMQIICDTATVTLSSPASVNGTLTLSNGNLNNLTQPLTMRAGSVIRRATGSLLASPVFGGKIAVAYISSVAGVVTGPEIPPAAGILGKLSIQTPMNIKLGSDIPVDDTLELETGLMFLHDYNLTLGPASVVTGAPSGTSMIVTDGSGEFRRRFSALPSSFTWPMGDTTSGNEYSPAAFAFSSAAFDSGAWVGIRVLNTKHPGNFAGTDYLKRYWIVSHSGVNAFTCGVDFHYADADVVGSESEMVMGQWDGSVWNYGNPASAASNELTGTVSEFSDFTGIAAAQTMTVVAGWNMISMPVIAPDMRQSILFPGASSKAFSYVGHYQVSDTLHTGAGYWLKFAAGPQDFSLSGNPVQTDSIHVTTGWNMIGTISRPVTTASLVPIGTSVTSRFFEYNLMYKPVDTLKPAKGYWVKMSAPGILVVGGSAPGIPAASVREHPAGENAGVSLTFENSRRQKQILRLYGSDPAGKTAVGNSDMPPLPPQGEGRLFDVRFASNRQAESVADVSGRYPVVITSDAEAWPVVISWKSGAGRPGISLVAGSASRSLDVEGSIVVADPSTRILVAGGASAALPSEVALEKNYPNPFNPVTVIRYGLPSAAKVTLTICTIGGQEVTTLVDNEQNSGWYTVEWNASSMASGVYFARLKAGDAVRTQKMILVK